MRRLGGRRLALLALLAVASFAAASTASARDRYDWQQYNRYVSHGPWRTHSTMTNSTSSWLTWTLSFTSRRCIDWRGDVSMGKTAGLIATVSSCTSTSRRYQVGVAPRSSLAFIQRPVQEYLYYVIRRFDGGGRLLATGYTHSVDSFTDYAFSDVY